VSSERHYLVVGSQTLRSARLLREMKSRAAQGPARFHLIVPAEKSRGSSSATESETRATTRERLESALADFSAAEIKVDGEVGDPSVLEAVRHALEGDHYDEIIVSTLPPGLSRWIHLDLASRLKHRYSIPVRHVVVPFDDLSPPTA
jgi:hypothetical protein